MARYEGYYASILYAIFSTLNLDIRVEDASVRGRADIVVIYWKQVFIFELKVADGADVEVKAEQALEQMRDRDYAGKYRRDGNRFHLLAVVFDREKRNLATVRVRQADVAGYVAVVRALNQGVFSRLAKTRRALSAGLMSVFSAKPKFDEQLFDEIEDQLIMADLGVATSQLMVERLRDRVQRQGHDSPQQVIDSLRQIMLAILNESRGDEPVAASHKPHVILMVGVNGVGKTTTLAKMAHRFRQDGQSVMLAACDTFRAAAIEQLQTWGKRLEMPVIAQSHGSDAAAVAFDAYSAANARGVDYLLIDTAGRQHTHSDLMAQLAKIKRVLARTDEAAPHDVYLTVDAGNGQNALSQVESFNRSIALTGLCITKLDGTARGGIVIALAHRFGLPVRYIGVGEGLADLQPFEADTFVAALLPDVA